MGIFSSDEDYRQIVKHDGKEYFVVGGELKEVTPERMQHLSQELMDYYAKAMIVNLNDTIMKNGKIMPKDYNPKKSDMLSIEQTMKVIDKYEVGMCICEIPLKLPSLNEYIKAINSNRHEGNKLKQSVQDDIMWFVKKLPKFEKPISIHFHWVEGNKKRDYDNISGAGHKFILDALVAAGKIKDDNRNYVVNTSDSFEYQKGVWKVILKIEECNESQTEEQKT